MKKHFIDILNKKYDIIYCDENNELSKSDLIGSIHHTKQKIFISNSIPKDTRKETILHEVIHNISRSVDIGLTEQQVTALSSVLYATYKLTPIIGEY